MGQGFWHPDFEMPRNLLPRPGLNPKIVKFMATNLDRPDYILPGLYQTNILSTTRNYPVLDYRTNPWIWPEMKQTHPTTCLSESYTRCTYSVLECEAWFPFDSTLSLKFFWKNMRYPGRKYPDPDRTNFFSQPDPKIFLKTCPNPKPISVRSGKIRVSGCPPGL